MENSIDVFNNADFGHLRVAVINGDPWFVGKDVASALGYSNTKAAIIRHVDEEDKKDGVTFRDPIGREQTPMLINESGVYALIFASKLPKAKAFKHWVTAEVLPSIRKKGYYVQEQNEQDAGIQDMLIHSALLMFFSTIKVYKRTCELNKVVHLSDDVLSEIYDTHQDTLLRCVNRCCSNTWENFYNFVKSKKGFTWTFEDPFPVKEEE